MFRVANFGFRIVLLSVLLLLICTEITSSQVDTSFSFINRVLNIDLEKTLRESFLKDNPNSKYAEVERITFQFQLTNFSRSFGSNEDYLIVADLETDERHWKAATTIILGFIDMGDRYEQKFRWIGWNKGFHVCPKLVDIDSDSVKEILIEEDDSGNQSTHYYVTLWKYMDGQFREVFQEGLDEAGGTFPYSYHNTYSFAKNVRSPMLLDIRFIMDAGISFFGEDNQEYVDRISGDYGIELPEHLHQEVMFSFDGSTYLPTVEVYDYEKPFRVYFESYK